MQDDELHPLALVVSGTLLLDNIIFSLLPGFVAVLGTPAFRTTTSACRVSAGFASRCQPDCAKSPCGSECAPPLLSRVLSPMVAVTSNARLIWLPSTQDNSNNAQDERRQQATSDRPQTPPGSS